jgi:hypothetical protein
MRERPIDLTGKVFWDFMKLLRERSREESRRVVVISANAKYHHRKMHKARPDAKAPDFRLEYFPPYSPCLSSIERVWELTWTHCLHDHYFATLDSVISAVEKGFTGWALGSSTIRKLCALP